MNRIVLVGMMGAGKTTIGRALAANRGWDFVDSDAQVEARTGRTVAEIWVAEGEQGFRVLESEALASALGSEQPAVVAAAGGVVLEPANRQLLRANGPVVWLKADPATLTGRLGAGSGRPLLADKPGEALEALAAVREPLYAEVADVVVDVDGLQPAQVVESIEAALQEFSA